jgi:hypothetical protein
VTAVSISLIVFACVFGGALLGMGLRKVLPEPHRSAESKDVIRAGTGMIATISALVLGLLVASAKETYDTQKDEVTAQAAKTALLDRLLAHYGPETKTAREALRAAVSLELQRVWSEGPTTRIEAKEAPEGEALYDEIQELTPSNESQRGIKAQASQLVMELGQTRWLMEAQKSHTTNWPLLVVVVFWLTINFVSFGIFAPRNATVVTTLFVCALSVAGAVFLILEMGQPYRGIIRISPAPMQALLQKLGS